MSAVGTDAADLVAHDQQRNAQQMLLLVSCAKTLLAALLLSCSMADIAVIELSRTCVLRTDNLWLDVILKCF